MCFDRIEGKKLADEVVREKRERKKKNQKKKESSATTGTFWRKW